MPGDERHRVRPAGALDVAPMVELYEQVAIEGGHILGEPPVDRVALAGRWRGELGRADGEVLVTERTGTVTGFAIVAALPVAEVSMLVGRPFRGQGAGRALLEAAVAWARGRGAARVVLEVFDHNAPAIALYRSCGFRDVAAAPRSHPRRTGETFRSVAMELPLQGS